MIEPACQPLAASRNRRLISQRPLPRIRQLYNTLETILYHPDKMSDDLRVRLGKARYEAQRQRSPSPLHHQMWAAAKAAYSAGYQIPENYTAVIISPDSIVNTPQKLQQLAGLSSLPEVKTTNRANFYPNGDEPRGETVQICQIAWSQIGRLKERTVWEMDLFKSLLWIGDEKRVAMVVVALKDPEDTGSDHQIEDTACPNK